MLTHSENRKPQEFNSGTHEMTTVSGVYPFLNTEQTLQSVCGRTPGLESCGKLTYVCTYVYMYVRMYVYVTFEGSRHVLAKYFMTSFKL